MSAFAELESKRNYNTPGVAECVIKDTGDCFLMVVSEENMYRALINAYFRLNVL